MMRRSSAAVLMTAVFVLATSMGGCGPMTGPNGPAQALPTYAGRATDLFDDAMDPAAVGMDFDKGYRPRADPLLRERAQVSDAVLRVKVSTVTAKRDGPEATYELGLQTVEKMVGTTAPPANFTVSVSKASESHGIMKNFEGRLIGYPFIAFVREFARPDGDREMHFHLAPDTKEVKSAVGDAVILGEAGAPVRTK